jgi:thiol-disulfide isomerase/thioredoxin
MSLTKMVRRGGVAGLAAIALWLTPRAAGAQRAIDLPIGSTAPDLKLETLDGKPASLAQYIGKVPMLMEVWAAWCPNCAALEPRILEAKKKYGDKVRFIGIAVSYNESPQRVKLHMEKHGFDVEMYYDRHGESDEVYGVKATSTIILVDRDGKIVYAGAGADQDFESALKKVL